MFALLTSKTNLGSNMATIKKALFCSIFLLGIMSPFKASLASNDNAFSNEIVHGLSVFTDSNELRIYTESLFTVYSRIFTQDRFLDGSKDGMQSDIVLFAKPNLFDEDGAISKAFLKSQELDGLQLAQTFEAQGDCVLSVTKQPSSGRLTYWGFVEIDSSTPKDLGFSCMTLLLSLVYGLELEKIDGASDADLIAETLKKRAEK